MDTETLLALLSSLLPKPSPDQETLLEALVKSEGDVQAAATYLSPSGSNKRKRPFALDEWLQKPGSSSDSSLKPRSKRVQSNTIPQTSLTQAPHRPRSVTAPLPGPIAPLTSEKEHLNNALLKLRPPQSDAPSQGPPQLPPLVLSKPDFVAEKTHCTLHPHVLPPVLARKLFEIMLDKAESWKRNRWWLFERAVTSPHKSSFFVRDLGMLSENIPEGEADPMEMQQAAHFWTYASQFETTAPAVFPDAMEEACKLIERVVNSEIRKRNQFGLEWGGKFPTTEEGTTSGNEELAWVPNVAAANCYSGAKENVGFHSDALSSLGPYPTIASLSLGVSRKFRLREVVPKSESAIRRPRSFDIPLDHNSLLIMHPPTQEIFKHAVIPQNTIDMFHYTSNSGEDCTSNSRINITFRFFRPDYRPSTIPKCKCGVPAILRPDMKGKRDEDGRLDRYWWVCQGGTNIQNEGKGCGMWQEMNAKAEGRGPFVSDQYAKKVS